MEEDWLTVEDVSERLKVKENTVRGWLRSGRLVGINFSGKTGWRIRRSEFERFLSELEGKAAA